MYTPIRWPETLSCIARDQKKYVLYLSLAGVHSHEEIKLAAPFLEYYLIWELKINGNVCLLFEEQEGMENAYNNVVGDDGPTKTNSYSGPCRIYALTINNKGVIQNENT